MFYGMLDHVVKALHEVKTLHSEDTSQVHDHAGGGTHILKIQKSSVQNFNWAINADDTIAYGTGLWCAVLSRFSHVPFSATLRTIARQAPLFLEFSRQIY